MTSGQVLRAKRDTIIAQRISKGETLRSVADDVGLSIECVRGVAIAAGVQRRLKQKNTAITVRTARGLWDLGMSAREIGEAMGVTKNVIIGIAHRNNFQSRPSPIKRAA